ncbi:Uncharacterized protein cmbei_4003640 [Cryptosporidium meleagridis]
MPIGSSLISEFDVLLLRCIESVLLESTKLSEIHQFIKDLKLMNKIVRNITRYVKFVFNKYWQVAND